MRSTVLLIALIAMITVGGITQRAEALPVGATYHELLIGKVGHRWLSPVYSLNIYYDEMLTNLTTIGNEFYGLRFATIDEVTRLAEAYRVPEWDDHANGNTSEPTIDLFQQDFGITHFDTFANLTRGMLDSSQNSTTVPEPVVNHAYFVDMNDPNEPNYYHTTARWRTNSGRSEIGSWLVVATHPVSEPSTMLLVGSGLIGLIAYRKKRQP